MNTFNLLNEVQSRISTYSDGMLIYLVDELNNKVNARNIPANTPGMLEDFGVNIIISMIDNELQRRKLGVCRLNCEGK